MTITLELPPELEQELAAEAEGLELPLAEYLLRVLEDGRVPAPETYPVGQLIVNEPREMPDLWAEARARLGSNPPQTGAELVAYWEREGVISSRPDIADSQEYARMLRDRAQRRTHT
jgi:hypothetical protein